jgi:hypothetical protein
MNQVCAKVDRERMIREIVAALATLEKCSDQEIENVRRFLRWLPGDALQDMRNKHREALEKRMAACPR